MSQPNILRLVPTNTNMKAIAVKAGVKNSAHLVEMPKPSIDEIADAVVYFLTATKFVTGQVLAVDGGLTQR